MVILIVTSIAALCKYLKNLKSKLYYHNCSKSGTVLMYSAVVIYGYSCYIQI